MQVPIARVNVPGRARHLDNERLDVARLDEVDDQRPRHQLPRGEGLSSELPFEPGRSSLARSATLDMWNLSTRYLYPQRSWRSGRIRELNGGARIATSPIHSPSQIDTCSRDASPYKQLCPHLLSWSFWSSSSSSTLLFGTGTGALWPPPIRKPAFSSRRMTIILAAYRTGIAGVLIVVAYSPDDFREIRSLFMCTGNTTF